MAYLNMTPARLAIQTEKGSPNVGRPALIEL
jgi:hypothetical protein